MRHVLAIALLTRIDREHRVVFNLARFNGPLVGELTLLQREALDELPILGRARWHHLSVAIDALVLVERIGRGSPGALADEMPHKEGVFLAERVAGAAALGEPFAGAHGEVADGRRDA